MSNPIDPAVIFTHCSDLKYDDPDNIDKHYFENNRESYIELYAERFLRYISCNSDEETLIKTVYPYIDIGFRESVLNFAQTGQFSVDGWVLVKENCLKNVLLAAEKRARGRANTNCKINFFYIGINDLIGVLENLFEVTPELMKFLSSRNGQFTYDSPKFIEAIIRLTRGDIPHLASNPIIRIDDDVLVQPESIKVIIQSQQYISENEPFYMFSGKYRRFDDSYDVVNDFAVRTDWFYPVGTMPSDPRFTDGSFTKQNERAELFLNDLSVFGAVQPISTRPYSGTLRKLIENKRVFAPDVRESSQLISGAGLCMSRRCVELLPPFMTFDNPVIWVDDHLKRRIHEMRGDSQPHDLEIHRKNMEPALFEQNRHPDGITQNYLDTLKTTGWYFERLMAGCLLHAIIVDDRENINSRSYSEIVRDIILFKTREELNQVDKQKLEDRLNILVKRTYGIILDCWQSDEFAGTIVYPKLISWIVARATKG